MKYNRTWTNWFIRFHRSISNDFRGYVILLCIALAIPCLISFFSSLYIGKDGWFHLYYVFGLNYPDGPIEEHPHKWLYLLIGIIGALVISGLMVTVFTNGVQRYVERIRNGRHYYKGLRNHYVLIGYNHLSISLIQHLLVDTDSEASLVILTKTDSSVLRAELQSSLDKNIEKRIIIYAADSNTQKQIGNLNLQNAKEVYVTIDENERGNQYTRSMLILKEIALQTKERSQDTLLKVNVLINESVTFDMVQRMVLPQNYYCYNVDGTYQQNIDLHIFNFYENWAKLLWSYNGQKKADMSYKYDSLDFEPIENTDKYVHLVIIGFNSMGRALLHEALRICHYPNYKEGTGHNRTHITIIDPAADILSLKFKSQIPYISQIKDIYVEFCKSNIEDIPIRERLASWAIDDKQMLTIAVCLSDPDTSMNIAMALPEVVFYQHNKAELSEKENGKYELIKNNVRTRVLVRQAVMKSVEDVILANHQRYCNLKIFGTFAEGMNTDSLDDSLAICINGIYNSNKDKGENWYYGPDADKDSILNLEKDIAKRFEGWKKIWYNQSDTSESDKMSTRYQVDFYRTLLSLLKRNDVLANKEFALKLAETEHRRWIAERTLAGWRNANTSKKEKRVNDLKIHNCIIPFSSLPDSERKKDVNVVVYAYSLVNGLKKLKND